MKIDDYTQLVAGLISGDPERVRAENRHLFEVAADVNLLTDGVNYHPDLILADAEQVNRDKSQ